MADFNVVGTPKVDITKWKKMTAQEIIKEEGKGEDIPAEIITWAQQMAAFAKIPDNVTYEQVDGDVGLDALNKLGLEDITLENENAAAPAETEEPDAIKDTDKTEETDNEKEQFSEIPESETAEESENDAEAGFSLADTTLTADNNEIRKRKERKGII